MEVTLEGQHPGYAGETPHGLGDIRVLLRVIQNGDHWVFNIASLIGTSPTD
jgi:hypothetical protein